MQPSLLMMQAHIANGDTVLMFAAGNLAYEAIGLAGTRDSAFFAIFGAHFMLVRDVDVGVADVGLDIVTWGRASPNPPPRITRSKLASWYRGYIVGSP